jgi:lipoprotein Spr
MAKKDEIVARARALVGVRFRPQGRSAESGLDCIGVAIVATGTDPWRVRRNYAPRSSDPEAMVAQLDACGFIRLAPPQAEAGDLLVVQAGPMQLHVLILTDIGFLHADARLRRVVEVPGRVPWPVLSAWRCPGEDVAAVRLH